MSLLTMYGGLWTRREAAHLLRRTCFGATPAQIQQAVTDGLSGTVTKLFTALPPPAHPIDPDTGVSYITGPIDPLKNNGAYNRYTKAWWADLMVSGPISIREKLTLFWHGHFTTGAQEERRASLMWQQNELHRRMAAGNFREYVRQISRDPAMLDYLNNTQNRKQKPNENYARELLELHTMDAF